MRLSNILVQLCVVLAVSAMFGAIARAQGSLALAIGDTRDIQVGPTFIRPGDETCNVAGVSVYYRDVQFYVMANGNYWLRTVDSNLLSHNTEPFLAVYHSPFDPDLPATNCLAADDDGAVEESQDASINMPLVAGTIYTAIITTSNPTATGLITWQGFGVGDMHYLASVTQTLISDKTTTSALFTIQLDHPETAYYVVLPSSAAPPTAAQVLAGQASESESVPITAGSFSVPSGYTNASVTIAGLSVGMTYTVYVVAANAGLGSNLGSYLFATTPPPLDTTPNPIVFLPQFGVPPSNLRRSNGVAITGIDAPAEITVTGPGSYAINDMSPTNIPGTVNAGDVVTVLQVSSTALSTLKTVVVHVGGVDAPFDVTTGENHSLVIATNFFGSEGICDEGGVALAVANDYNNDGDIDPGELRYTREVCNGGTVRVTSQPLSSDANVCPNGGVEVIFDSPNTQPVSNGPSQSAVHARLCHGLNSLIDVTELDENDDACPKAGVRVTTWLDENGDGELSEGEPSVAQNVCHASNALVETSTLLPDPEVCPNGGIRFHSGTDADADGELDGDEVTTDKVICSGANALVNSKPLDPNPDECPTGGVQMDSGTDVDGNGVLEGSEVTTSRKSCSPVSTLTRSTKLAAATAACAFGGVKIESGLDVNGDETLDDGEVKTTATVCNGSGLAVRTRTLNAGSEDCRAGGAALETGIDTDGDGQLDTSEVVGREVVCQPPQLLFETEKLLANDETCPHGGLRLTSGLDDGDPSGTPSDGKLQAEEVELNKAVCLAPVNVLIGGTNGACSAMPSQRRAGGLLWWLAAGSFAIVVRRRRRGSAQRRA